MATKPPTSNYRYMMIYMAVGQIRPNRLNFRWTSIKTIYFLGLSRWGLLTALYPCSEHVKILGKFRCSSPEKYIKIRRLITLFTIMNSWISEFHSLFNTVKCTTISYYVYIYISIIPNIPNFPFPLDTSRLRLVLQLLNFVGRPKEPLQQLLVLRFGGLVALRWQVLVPTWENHGKTMGQIMGEKEANSGRWWRKLGSFHGPFLVKN